MKSMLEALYYGEIHPEGNIVPRDPEYRKINRSISEAMEIWKEKLSADDFNQLEAMLDLCRQSESMYATSTFTDGFQLGALMMIEIYAAMEELLYDLG
ncbi:hypothetical protein P4H94_24135 [Paenibacillus macerans]|uniref:Uncharacterized protein n=2 Tax=Paenibacillus TaxID=44249 RepID=A0A090ZY36_PAEMA|nr:MULTISPECIES: DUF6809 family protein [Paenibacillus]KFN09016.1 hypothetical protein DJ90_2677 [Paenibacillus macerans]MBS5913297.1 hypothetical protein [Paenibacillus macerans]MCY7560813.1 hypothetical protein [Paenibacillus macerans]MEC0139948.1 hypothetical protein [Paenibacillus macerans]MEC0151866.1 hypothetical protein [Paenibacillus macerans]